MVKIKVKKLKSEATLPKYALPGDAGLDLFSCEDVVVQPGQRHIFGIGVAMEFPEGYVALVWDKGGVSNKRGMKVLGGVYEHTYRGEYLICLLNTSDQPQEFKKGEKIAQLLIQPIVSAEIEESDQLSETIRGAGRHGSTGK